MKSEKSVSAYLRNDFVLKSKPRITDDLMFGRMILKDIANMRR